MRTKFKVSLVFLIAMALIALLYSLASHGNFALLNAQGPIARQERNLIILAVSLMMVIVLPVFVATVLIAWRYRATNQSAKYTPTWDHGRKVGVVLWGLPIVIIGILAVINWQTTHRLDPFKPLASNVQPITIQVIALRWKWLFLYPEQNLATVNFVEFPQGTPVDFQLTSDAPMSSFWIPQLGGQMYAMAGMSTQTHLMADEPGTFEGSAAEINGPGFAGMKFKAMSVSQKEFMTWVQTAKATPTSLSLSEYNKLAQPTESVPESEYSSVEKDLYNMVMEKYTMPTQGIE